MKKEKSILRVSISLLLVLMFTIVIAISGCIENTNINNSALNSNQNITNNSDNTLHASENMTDNTTDYKTDSKNNITIKNNANITVKKSITNNTDNITTRENDYNVIVVITVSNASLLNSSLLKIFLKNIEKDKIYGWKELNKSINQTDNECIYVENLPAGKFQIIIMFHQSAFEIPVNFSLNKTDKIYINLNISTGTKKANDTKVNNTNNTIVINALIYKNLNLTTSKIFEGEIITNSERNKTEILDCEEKCKAMCNSAEEKCNVNNNIDEKCANLCEQNLYSEQIIQRCQNEINERCKIKCESENKGAENQKQCNFRCKMNSLQPCIEKYVADERSICISQCKENALCSDSNFECYYKCLKECKNG